MGFEERARRLAYGKMESWDPFREGHEIPVKRLEL